MSLESSIERLACALERQADNSAVSEIIRQRDAWQQRAERLEKDSNFYREARDRHWERLQHQARRIAALRGVIKRMKRMAA